MEGLLDIKDAAKFLNVSETTIRRWTNSGALKCFRVGGKRERRFQMKDLQELLDKSSKHPMESLGFKRQKAPEGAHMTHFYSGKREAFAVSVPYLVEGIKQDESLLAVMSRERSSELLAILDRQGHPAATWLKNGRLTVTTGKDSALKMIDYLAEFAAGANKFRVVGDMIWTVQKGWDLAALTTLEQAPMLTPPVENGLLLCQYSLDDFSGAGIMMAFELHSHIIYKSRLRESPYYAHAQE